MIVSEEDLAPYRRAYQTKSIGCDLLNGDLFTWSEEYFELASPAALVPGIADHMTVVVVFAFRDEFPVLPHGLDWVLIEHQAGGTACERHYLAATRLLVRPDINEGLCRLALARWPGQSAGWDGCHTGAHTLKCRPSELEAYRAELDRLGLSYSGTWLTESLYPIDPTQANLDRLCIERRSLWEFGLSDGPANTWSPSILVVCANSD